ncbi:FAD-binding domain-containing protein, partial [Punctularia strigosozonata HHB-11173 SS5]|uniref:FAD-binding domain-containing protein n=1 Tax=Punctularia strigosozonata (strain HHB-11173) TaxID=741275 RepID=UPI0004417D1E
QMTFQVKGGGHSYNQEFSSTPGVQISMSWFNEVVYDASTSSVSVGSGLIWDDVYAALIPLGVNVVGGRSSGVGVAGLTLGGGYSYLSNQHGLSHDNVLGYEVVVPSGTVVNVTENAYPDLFFALRGGYNNFGIVTQFTLRTYPQGPVWGGMVVYSAVHVEEATAAAAAFTSVTDANAELNFVYAWTAGQLTATAVLFYNGPTPPAGIFDRFLDIPATISDVSTRNFTSMVLLSPDTPHASGHRGRFGTVPVIKYSDKFLKAALNETVFWGTALAQIDPTAQHVFIMEPFLPSVLSHGAASAYPVTREITFLPSLLQAFYTDPAANQIFQRAMQQSTAYLHDVAIDIGDSLPFDSKYVVVYGNYANAETRVEDIYGANLDRLRVIKQRWDPENVMGLTGGWKIIP